MRSKVLFIHDHKFRVSPTNAFFSEGKITNVTLSRYLHLGDAVTVVGRKVPISEEQTSSYACCSGEGISFRPLKGLTWHSILISNFAANSRRLFNDVKSSDIVVLRLPSVLAIVVCLVLRLQRKPYIVEVVGDARESLNQALGNTRLSRIASVLFSFLTKRIIYNAIAAMYVTEEVLQKKYPCSGITDYASNVEIDPVDDAVLRARIRRGLELHREGIKIGLIGSYYNNYKGIDNAIEMVSRLSKEFPCIKLHVLGSGDETIFSEVFKKTGAESHVVFDGVIPRHQVGFWLDKIDIYCQPSRTEGLPRSLIEAMSRGCPAVGSSVGGIPELLSSHYIFPPGDIERFCSVVRRLVTDKSLRKNASLVNFEKATDYYSNKLDARRRSFYKKVRESLMVGD